MLCLCTEAHRDCWFRPQNDAEWAAVQTSAAVLAESGNRLVMRGRREENGEPVPFTCDEAYRFCLACREAPSKGQSESQ
jgi:hypothetical protein